MRSIELIVIGGSAGSLQVLLSLFPWIPAGFPVPLLLVLHRNSQFESALEDILASRTSLLVSEVEEKEVPQPGNVYLAPADYHVLIEHDGSFSLDNSEPVHFSRPSIDVSFKTAADFYGDRLVCMLLSGGNADGAEGLAYVKARGGITVVQDPVDAESPFMPRFALQITQPCHILTGARMGEFIRSLWPPRHA
ncbi:MAG: chemotaxis protein CheB [Puia sp.]|nr:chemotaxis protein CheB [Puia sp.]